MIQSKSFGQFSQRCRSPSISFGVPVCISRKPMLHTTTQIWLGCFDHRMNVICHPAKGQHDPANPGNFVAQSLRKSRVVSIIVKQRPTTISTSHQMIDRTGILSRGGRSIPQALFLSDVSYQPTPANRATDAYAIPNLKSDPNSRAKKLTFATAPWVDMLPRLHR